MRILIAFAVMILSVVESFAQESSGYRRNNYFDASVAIGNQQYAGALSWAHLHGLGKKKQRFKVGYGLRFTSYFGTEKDFITAPAKLTSRQTGPQVLFSKTYEESLDTVTFDRSQINMLNIAIYLQYSITPKFDVAFNIDAVGFSFGKRQEGVLTSTLKPSSLETRQPGKPTSFNVLLVSDNDIGSLNSELVLRYRCKDNLAIKAGYCFLFAEYTTDSKLIFDNDRFRNKAGMIVLGVSYNLFNIN